MSLFNVEYNNFFPIPLAREIDYLVREERAVTAEDILYRRSKLGLHVPSDGCARLDDWLARHERLP